MQFAFEFDAVARMKPWKSDEYKHLFADVFEAGANGAMVLDPLKNDSSGPLK